MTVTIDDVKSKTEEIRAYLKDAIADGVITADEEAKVNKLLEELGNLIFDDGIMSDEEKELADKLLAEAKDIMGN